MATLRFLLKPNESWRANDLESAQVRYNVSGEAAFENIELNEEGFPVDALLADAVKAGIARIELEPQIEAAELQAKARTKTRKSSAEPAVI